MLRVICILALAFAWVEGGTSFHPKHPPTKQKISKKYFLPFNDICENLIPVNFNRMAIDIYYLPELYQLSLDTLPQIKYWKNIICLSEDSVLFSTYPSRKVLYASKDKFWKTLSDEQKKSFKDSLIRLHGLDSNTRILITGGKRYFYDFNKSVPLLEKGVYEFYLNGVDPWYAQAILLIESPNKLQKSNAGAYGPFQLMKKVARMYGLKVNRHEDERADFSRSAYAASRLIHEICLPKAREICDYLGFCEYRETDLWFRLLVMHIYHAGYGNVMKAVNKIESPKSDMSLIYKLWNTEAGGFGNASQNYSQLILATHLVLYEKTGVSKIF
ncbi:MAG: transglycosylase SLT domain-containing protein [Bacteroidia bacterium]|nr:transglycosylase SLT domain-containing protein [Bacteroidia bacterium]